MGVSAAKSYDAVVVGAGHNGLVNACYLARAGLKVLVLSATTTVGGAAVSRRLYDGFTYSNCSYVCSLLRTEIIRALELPLYGLQIIPYEGGCTMMRDGGHLALYDNHDALRREISRHSVRDAEAYERYVREHAASLPLHQTSSVAASHPTRLLSARATSGSCCFSAGISPASARRACTTRCASGP